MNSRRQFSEKLLDTQASEHANAGEEKMRNCRWINGTTNIAGSKGERPRFIQLASVFLNILYATVELCN